jgi:RsiW-degrading membrane proteinase PrsW (M82 family)
MDIPFLYKNQINPKIKSRKYFLPYLSAVILPSMIRSYLFRNAETQEKEKKFKLYLAFLYGFSISTYLSLITNTYFSYKITYYFICKGINIEESIKYSDIITSTIIAPVFEEIFKGFGMFIPLIYDELNEEEDGIIFGAEIGNGFATIENIFYGRMMNNKTESILLILIRQLTSSALHTYASATIGEGVSLYKLKIYNRSDLLKKFLLAIFIHGLHNFSCIFIPSKNIYLQIISYSHRLLKLRKKIQNYDKN